MANKGLGGLGKGLGALGLNKKPQAAPESKDSVHELNIQDITANRFQPRLEFDESALDSLKESIQHIGILEPLLVRKLPKGGYELIAGERRLRAAKLAGLKTVPVMVREYNDAETSEIALIENIQRENLNAIEEAKAYARLTKDFGLTQEAMAKKLGRSRSHIANFLRLLNLNQQVQDYLVSGVLSMGQAKPLLGIENLDLQLDAAEYIQEEELSARQCEALVKKLQENPAYLKERKNGESAKRDADSQDVFTKDAVERLTHLFGTQVKIRAGKKKSKIEIEFYSPEDLERIMGTILERQDAVKKAKIDALRKVSLSQNGSFTV